MIVLKFELKNRLSSVKIPPNLVNSEVSGYQHWDSGLKNTKALRLYVYGIHLISEK